jgi:hypothetical protein
MTRRISIIFFLLSLINIAIHAEFNQVQLISANNDYGLELDWMQQFVSNKDADGYPSVGNVVFDKDGSIYVAGDFRGTLSLNGESLFTVNNKGHHMFIIKFTSDKKMVWAKLLAPSIDAYNVYCEVEEMMFSKDKHLIVKAKTTAVDLLFDSSCFYMYDGESYEPISGETLFQTAILTLNTETGELENSFVTKAGFVIDQLKIDNTQNNFYLSANMVKNFNGMNKNMPSNSQSTGKYDKYFAKLSSDFKLIWDFSINETSQYDGYMRNGNDQLFLSGDSLYVISTYCSDIQINPDKNDPVHVPYVGVAGEQSFYNVLFARYNVKGQKPVLESYSYNPNSPNIVLLSVDKDGKLYGNLWIRNTKDIKTGHVGVQFRSDMSYDTIKTIPMGESVPHGMNLSRTPWQFNESNSLEFRFSAASRDADPININDTLSISLNQGEYWWGGFAKYDSDMNFRYVYYFTEKYLSILQCYTDDKHGNVFLLQGNNTNDYTINWSLNEDTRETFPLSQYSGIVKYTETFRIRETLSDKGTIKQAGEMVRYGSDVKIEVEPQKGYRADSVVTSTGYLLEKQSDGTFLLPHVTDRVIIKAYYSPSTGIADNSSEKIQVYPNPATDRIHVSTIDDFHYVLTDVKGRKITEGVATDGTVNVASLTSGCYLLQINNDKIVRFEKK